MNSRFIVLKTQKDTEWVFDSLKRKTYSLNKNFGVEKLRLIYESQANVSEKIKLHPMLNQIQLCLTHQCNLTCLHCYQKNHDDSSFMPLGLVKKIFQEVSRNDDIKMVNLNGGEPFLHKDIFEILELSLQLLDLDKRVIVNTNGTIFRQSDMKKLDNRIEFTISVDGSTEQQNRLMRGPDRFQGVLSIIEALVSNGNLVTINSVINRYTWNDMRGICDIGKRLGVSKINFLPHVFIDKSEAYVRDLIIPHEKRSDFLKEKRLIKEQYCKDFFSGKFMELHFLSKALSARKEFPIIILPCPAGNKKCYVEPNGDVIPCYYLKGWIGGNLQTSSLEKIWSSPDLKFERARAPFIVTKEDMPGCVGCDNALQCFKENFDNVLLSNLPGDLIKEIICFKP